MSFRTRLTWYFLFIVIVPIVAVGAVLLRLVADSERGKSDARLAQAQRSASALYEEAQDSAARAGRTVVRSEELARALRGDEPRRVGRVLDELADRAGATRAVLELPRRGRSFEAGAGTAVAPAVTEVVAAGGRRSGTLRLAVAGAEDYARRVAGHTGLDVVVTGPGGVLASTTAAAQRLPDRGRVEVAGREFRVTSFSAPGFDAGEELRVRLLADQAEASDAITRDSVVVASFLLAFLVLAFTFALMASRSLQAQIGRLLEAARRLGRGEFAVEVPTEGNDEFAALGGEFNAMARQLERRLSELQTERARLQEAFRRVGESFAKGLDRDALLDIVVETAVDGVGAEAGRALVRGYDGFEPQASSGTVIELQPALEAAEAAVLQVRRPSAAESGGAHSLAHPLTARDRPDRVIGIVSIARRSGAFSAAERDLFDYLASQVAVSIENVDLHETVQRQAVTDDLTGLSNHRRFQEVMSAEVERARRFGTTLGLLMIDLDDFKSINDVYGHLQGDLVLREVARILRETCREVDEPARYGGEELAVALPGTDLEGAARFAERLRARIEALELPVLDGSSGGPVRVTASFGAATLPGSAATDKEALVAAADAALYTAKRMGKNRVVKAG